MKFLNVDDGDVFELGGASIRAIAAPGHTAGSIAYYYQEGKICFTGDCANADEQIPNIGKHYNNYRGTLTKLLGEDFGSETIPYAQCFTIYAKILRRLIGIIGEDVTVFSGHLDVPLTVGLIKNVAGACDEIGQGKTELDPPGESIFNYQSNAVTGRDLRMHFYGNVDVMYDRKQM